jgi:formyl-CoA transferase
VIENFIPGGADKLGLGWDELRAEHPALVYCSIRGYPRDSPRAMQPGFDFAIQAEGGIMSITGSADGPPMKVGVAIADITSGMFAASGITAALYAVRGGAPGRHIEVSLHDSQLAWLANRGTEATVGGLTPDRMGNAHPSIVPYETFPTQGAHIVIAVGTDLQFRSLCDVLELVAVGTDERFATNPARVLHRDALIPLLGEATARWPADALLTALAARDVPCGPVCTIPEALAMAPYALQPHDHPTAGPISTIRSPIAVDGAHLTSPLHPPLLGEHTAAVLRDAGLDDAEIDAALAGPCRTEV